MLSFQTQVGVVNFARRARIGCGGFLHLHRHQTGSIRRVQTTRHLAAVVMVTVDSHVHVWDPAFAPDETHPLPDIVGTADDLIAKMNAAGLDKTVVVQPINYKFNHACVSDAMKRHPDRLYGVALADTSLPAEEASATVGKLLDAGYLGVRINPSFASLRSDSVLAVLKTCGELGKSACIFARPEHYDDVEYLLQTTECDIVIDHFGFAGSESEVSRMLTFAKYERAYVKASAWFRVSKEAHPHGDVQTLLRRVVEAYGSHRVLAGTDYPYVTQEYGYGETFSAVRSSGLSSIETSDVCGGSAAKLYKLL